MQVELSRPDASAFSLSSVGTVIFVGHARLPQSLTSRDASPVVSVELETGTQRAVRSGVSARAVPELGARLVAQVLNSRNINDSPLAAMEEIRRR